LIARAALVLGLAACGSSAPKLSCPVRTPTCASTPAQFFVAPSGSDGNPGTQSQPFKTLTHALSVAGCGNQVHVAPGTYDAANGETFPLNVPPGVSLYGDEAARGQGATHTTIHGAAFTGLSTFEADVHVMDGATVAGFEIVAAPAAIDPVNHLLKVLVFDADNITIRNNTISANPNVAAIVISWGAHTTVAGNTISGSPNGNGLEIDTTKSDVCVEENVMTGNKYGVTMGPGADLGGGASGSSGHNTISCNSMANVWFYMGDGAYSLANNKWDHAPPTSAPGNGTLDIKITDGGMTFDAHGAERAPSPCP
jgi:hypothetical protein